MTKKEELKTYIEKYNELKVKFETAQQDFIAFNKMFDAWLQSATRLTDAKGQIHLSEILSAWDKNSND